MRLDILLVLRGQVARHLPVKYEQYEQYDKNLSIDHRTSRQVERVHLYIGPSDSNQARVFRTISQRHAIDPIHPAPSKHSQ